MFAFIRRSIILTAALATSTGFALTEDFSTNPLSPTGNWVYGIGDNSNSQFIWNSAETAQYTGDATGSLGVHLNSTLPTARLQRSLGTSVSQSDNFSLATRFSFSVTSAPTNQFMQMAFGLVNSTLTGGDRTGSLANFTSDNTFHTIEFSYFPNMTTFTTPPSGRTLTPAVFGAQQGTGDAFSNFASVFGDDSNLTDNQVGINELPQLVVLQAVLDFDAASHVLSLSISRVNADGSLTLLNTEVPGLDLDVQFGYDPTKPFVVDTLAIMAYKDGFADPSEPSLVADLTFQRFEFSAIPEPSTALLVGWSVAALILGGRVRRK